MQRASTACIELSITVPTPLDVLRIHPNDNVCVAIHPLAAGSEVVCGELRFTVVEDVRLGAKLALRALQKDDLIIKFGEPIGFLHQSVAIGGYIHTHNLSSDYAS